MTKILFIILIVLIAARCCRVAIENLVGRGRQPKPPVLPLKNLELLKEQGMITAEELESMKEGTQRPQELAVESCILSAEEVMEAIEAALGPVNNLEIDDSYTGSEKWTEAFEMQIELNLSLKELTLLSMKMVKPRPAIDLIAEILAMSIPVDLFDRAGDKGDRSPALPSYKAAARMIWVKARERLSEPVSIQKEIYEQRKIPEQKLLARLLPIIMKSLNIPVTASGFAAILALMTAKIEFNAFSHEEDDES